MNELELKKLWQTTNEKLEESFIINRKNTEDITRITVHNFLGSMKPVKIFTLLAGLLWVGVGASVLSEIYLNAFFQKPINFSSFLLPFKSFSRPLPYLFTSIN